ncbi:amastin-like surface protein, putative [Leishmania donovani]|uniref:Amastin-like surface protein, putative n=1 Tax=Leishmania donovani TaxID=5661 RepID=E9BQW8_LEIDO|nr:amastin-like surface protein, putative [Leishmania donovani]CBZ37647.1 amastin-like surface protein, putative [Leishmania donovani]
MSDTVCVHVQRQQISPCQALAHLRSRLAPRQFSGAVSAPPSSTHPMASLSCLCRSFCSHVEKTCSSVTVLLYVILQFIAFLLVLVATPIDMFRLKKLYQYPHPNPCYTLWGAKFDCSSSTYSVKLSMMWSPCPSRRNLFRLAQVFAVISIFLYGAAFILGLIVLRCCPWLRWVCLVLNIAGMATLCIVWAAMVVTYYKDVPQRCMPLHFFVNYGAGFGLCLVAWCLDIINIGLLLLPLRVRDPGKIGKSVPSPRPGDEK